METNTTSVFWVADLGQLTGASRKANSMDDAISAGLNQLNDFVRTFWDSYKNFIGY